MIFTKLKHFDFDAPKIEAVVNGDEIIIASQAYSKYLAIVNDNDDFILSDNYFDMNKGSVKVKILSEKKPRGLKVRSVFNIQ